MEINGILFFVIMIFASMGFVLAMYMLYLIFKGKTKEVMKVGKEELGVEVK